MKKLTKTQVIALAKKRGDQITNVELYPSKCGPANQVWVKGMNIALTAPSVSKDSIYTENGTTAFERDINNFSYYNCNSELGKRVHFYVKDNY